MEYGLKTPNILLPKCALEKWAVIACDQFTSQPEYWDNVKEIVGEEKSTLNLIFPEIYLSNDNSTLISKINNNMKEYLSSGVLNDMGKGFILIKRDTPYSKGRLGLIISVDLEEYSFEKGTSPKIRATEGTIVDRLPPRIEIRKNAEIELPHIMLLIDDNKNYVLKELYAERDNFEKVYDFDLMLNGGHLTGYFIKDENAVYDKFKKLFAGNELIERYGKKEEFLFAVGDGNHSLATAKRCWEAIKQGLTEEEAKNHPARFALVEVVNLYDEALKFEPIHRYVLGIDENKFKTKLQEIFKTDSLVTSCNIICKDGCVAMPSSYDLPDTIRALDEFISKFIKENGGSVDYIHGESDLKELVSKNANSIGILLPKMDKNTLFTSVIKSGALPRKTFSMGEAVEKRYYVECKKI